MVNWVLARRSVYIFAIGSLGACGWVDETGRQSNTLPAIVLDDSNLLTEDSTVRWPLRDFDPDGDISSISFHQTASGSSVRSCNGKFASQLVAPTLQEACQPNLGEGDCQVVFNVGSSDVSVSVPALRRPAAMSYQVQVVDEDGAADTQAIDLCIESVSERPKAVDDLDYSVTYLGRLEHSGTRFDEQCMSLGGTGVLANDSDDFDGSEGWDSGQSCLRVKLVEPPVYAASFDLHVDGGFSYVSSGAAGPGTKDTFSYTIDDGKNLSDVASVTILISGDNQPPTALNPRLSLSEDTVLDIASQQIANDPEGTQLNVEAFTQPSSGSVQILGEGLRYTPESNAFGETFFEVTLVDAAGSSVDSRVDIEVLEVNDKPIIRGLPGTFGARVTNPSDIPEFRWIFSVEDEETGSESLTVSLQFDSSIADIQLDGPSASGEMALVLTPVRDGSGVAVLQVSDLAKGELAAQTTEISIPVIVSGLNQAPVALDDQVELFKNQVITVSVLDNDIDPDGLHSELKITAILEQPSHGRVEIIGSGRLLRYVSETSRSLVDRLVYEITDSHGAVAQASVEFDITNRAPIVVSESSRLNAFSTVAVDVLRNDSDPDGDELQLVVAEGGYVGQASIVNGRLVYNAPSNYEGIVRVPYEVRDGDGGVGDGVLTITIERGGSGR